MSKIKKDFLTPKWLVIKEMFEKNTNDSTEYGSNFPIGGELDQLCHEFIDILGEITMRNGFDYVVEGTHLDIWKTQRIWLVVEKAGLLEQIAWKSDLEDEEINDTWYQLDPDFDYNEEDFVNENIK
jgi:hypothetical protein